MCFVRHLLGLWDRLVLLRQPFYSLRLRFAPLREALSGLRERLLALRLRFYSEVAQYEMIR